LVRWFTIRIDGPDIKNPIRAVESRYNGLVLERDEPRVPVTALERVYREDGGNKTGKHELLVVAELLDGSSESFARIWDE
jgi:hypothetical protein